MPTVSVLYIGDHLVGPHLELLRNVCDPTSRSRPHVTVRYFDKVDRTREQHLQTTVEYIDLIEPGAFGLEDATPGASRVVFIRCESESLEALEHKPDYPASEFHITIYDGKDAEFANGLLALLREYRWSYRVPLPEDTTLSEIVLKPRRVPSTAAPRRFPTDLQSLFREVVSKDLTESFLSHLSSGRRLMIARAICAHLAMATADLPSVEGRYTDARILTEPTGTTASGGRATTQRPDQWKASPDRSIHVTPPELAEDMARLAVGLLDADESLVDFGDPAVGVGAFYQALLRVLPSERIASAIGVDEDPRMALTARRRWESRGLDVRRGDFLHMERLPHRSLILANPPYLRHQKMKPEEKDALRQRASVVTGQNVSARSGQYVYFLLLSHAWMKPDAIAVWLIPAEFMSTAYGAALRHYLTEKVELVRIHQFAHDDPQFENIQVLPAVVAFRNRRPIEGHRVCMTANGTLFDPGIKYEVPLRELRPDPAWRPPQSHPRKTASTPIRIGDLFVVKRGIATGANSFFVLARDEAKRLGLPDLAVRPVLPKARQLSSDIVGRADDGYPLVEPQLSLLDCDLPREVIEGGFPRLAEYLAEGERAGVTRGTLVRSRTPWYRQERREPARFLCTYMGRGARGGPPIRFIWNQSDAVATNTYLMMYPREPLESALAGNPARERQLFEILRETASDDLLQVARMHAGGLRKIEPGELRATRLARSTDWLDSAVDAHLQMD